jgi:Domain of unknown function (DUF3883)
MSCILYDICHYTHLALTAIIVSSVRITNMNIQFNFHLASSNTLKGSIAEHAIARYLRKIGYKAKVMRHAGYDILAVNKSTGETIRIEVKVSTQNKDKKYRATTYKYGRYGHTDHTKSDVIIFLCQLPYTAGQCVPFIIPTQAQGNKTFLCVTSNPLTYNGKLAQYRNDWSMFQ